MARPPRGLDDLLDQENAQRDLQQIKFEQPPEEPIVDEAPQQTLSEPSDVIAVGEPVQVAGLKDVFID
jgi:hypothetical protein